MAKVKSAAVDISEVVEGLGKLSEQAESIARTMAVAMGKVVRDEAKLRAPLLKPENLGTDGQPEGLLRDSIYLAYDKSRSFLSRGQYIYAVSWNSRVAAHGHFLEFGFAQEYKVAKTDDGLYYTPLKPGTKEGYPRPGGPLRVGPTPFLGPAFDAQFPRLRGIAISAGQERFRELIK